MTPNKFQNLRDLSIQKKNEKEAKRLAKEQKQASRPNSFKDKEPLKKVPGSVPNVGYQAPAPRNDGGFLSRAMNIRISKKEIDQAFIIVPDIHSYVRDIGAYELCMEAMKVLNDTYNVTKVVQLGDLMECGELSRHPPSHLQETIPSYMDEVKWAIDDFWARSMSACPNAKQIALLGNHEHRVNNWLLEKLGSSKISQDVFNDLSPTNLYKQMGIQVIPYGNEDAIDGTLNLFSPKGSNIPSLVCVHGWSFAVNCAKAHLDKMMGATSVIFGHTHRIQSYIRRNPMTNANVGAWNIGALAKTNMFYQKGIPCDHALAFAVVFTYGDSFEVVTLPILGNTTKHVILPNGAVLTT